MNRVERLIDTRLQHLLEINNGNLRVSSFESFNVLLKSCGVLVLGVVDDVADSFSLLEGVFEFRDEDRVEENSLRFRLDEGVGKTRLSKGVVRGNNSHRL